MRDEPPSHPALSELVERARESRSGVAFGPIRHTTHGRIRATIRLVIDEELTSPEAFALAVSARASYFARHVIDYEFQMLRPYAQLTLLLGIELEPALNALTSRGLRGAYRWAMDGAASLP